MATVTQERTGLAAGLALALAIGGIVLTASGAPGWGLLAHFGGVLLGAVGLVMAASPRVSGGLLSIAALVISLFGIGLDIFVLLGMLVF